MLIAIVQHDTAMLTMLIQRIGQPPPNLDEAGLATDVADFVGHYSTQSLENFDLSGALTDMVEIIRRYQAEYPRLQLIDNPQQIVSTGLNTALAHARGR